METQTALGLSAFRTKLADGVDLRNRVTVDETATGLLLGAIGAVLTETRNNRKSAPVLTNNNLTRSLLDLDGCLSATGMRGSLLGRGRSHIGLLIPAAGKG
jgi:hypothetical protein